MAEYMTLRECAVELDVSRQMVWRYVSSRRLPGKLLGRQWLVTRVSLLRFKEFQDHLRRMKENPMAKRYKRSAGEQNGIVVQNPLEESGNITLDRRTEEVD